MKLHSSAGILIITALLSLSGCSSDETALDKAQSALAEGDFATASSVADSAITGGGGDKATYRAKGIALLGQGDYENAKDCFVRALSCSNGIVEQADYDISYYLAVTEFKMGDAQAAKDTVDAIIALRPKDDAAYFLRGKIGLYLGDKNAAIADFDKTVTLAPKNYDRYVGIYEELHAKGFDAEAASYLEKALAAGDKLSDYNKGLLEYYMGSYTEARNDLENARKSGDNENLTLYLGKTYEALGDTTYAMTLYEEFLRQNPEAGRIYEQYSTCLLNKGEYDQALTTIESGLTMGKGEGVRGMMFNRIVAYERLYDFENAKTSMKEYLELYPDDEVAKRENVFLSSR